MSVQRRLSGNVHTHLGDIWSSFDITTYMTIKVWYRSSIYCRSLGLRRIPYTPVLLATGIDTLSQQKFNWSNDWTIAADTIAV